MRRLNRGFMWMSCFCLCKCECVAVLQYKFAVKPPQWFWSKQRVSIYSANINPAAGHTACVDMQIYVSPLCLCVCVSSSSAQLACRLCWKLLHGVSESFLLWDLYCWKLGISPKALASPLFLSLSSSLSLSDSLISTGESIFIPFSSSAFFFGPTFSAYLHHLWASQITAQIGCSTFLSPLTQKSDQMRDDWGPSLTFRSL